MIVVMDDLPEGGAKRVVFEQIKGLSCYESVAYFTNRLPSQFGADKWATRVFQFDTELIEARGMSRPLKEWSYITRVRKQYQQMVKIMADLEPKVVIVHPSRHTQAPELLTILPWPTIYYAEEWPRVVYEPKAHPLPSSWPQRGYEAGRRWWVKQIDSRSAKAASRIVANSNFMAAKLTQIYQRPVEVIHPGVDNSVFYPKKVTAGPDYFLFIGEKEAVSGYNLLANFRFPVKVVDFKAGGFRYTDQALADLYRGAVATLCLAKDEPFGLTAIESMACGTPVIAVKSGGHQDTVVDYQTGRLIHLNEVELNEAAELMLKNRSWRNKLGAEGVARVQQNFLWSNHVDKLNQLIGEVAK